MARYTNGVDHTASKILSAATIALFAALTGAPAVAAPSGVTNAVLVHGGFVDGSGRQAVYADLRTKG
jgi:hypothetical protein